MKALRHPVALAGAFVAALVLTFAAARAEITVAASGAYPEGLLWKAPRLFFTEMGADRVTLIENGTPREFWHMNGCGPTSLANFGPKTFLVTCHLGREVVEISDTGATMRHFPLDPKGQRLQDPNASFSDGEGGVFFTDSGVFNVMAPATGRVYHLAPLGNLTLVLDNIKYANGVVFDHDKRTLYVSEHLARRVLALDLDRRFAPTSKRVFIDFAKQDETRAFKFEEAGPDGLAFGPGVMAVAEYGESRVHIFDRSGAYRTTVKVSMPFVDTVVFDDSNTLFAGGSFQNITPPYEGMVSRIPQSDWDKH